jgi:tetratricopeptide (TPR) repeat protein
MAKGCLVLLLIVAVFIGIYWVYDYVNAEISWKHFLRHPSVAEYHYYVSQHPESKYSRLLDPALDNTLWDIARQENTEEGFEAYSRFPTSGKPLHYSEATTRREALRWDKISRSVDIDASAAEVYLDDFSGGQHRCDLVELLVKQHPSHAGFRKATQECHNDQSTLRWIATASANYDARDEESFAQATSDGSIDAYGDYVLAFPDGTHAAEATHNIVAIRTTPPEPSAAKDTSTEMSANDKTDDNTDVIISPAYIETKVAEAKQGKLDYEFAAFMVQAGEKAFMKGAGRGAANGWLLSAQDKYQAALRLYEAGRAAPPYVAVTSIHLGAVEMHLGNLDYAEKLETRGTSMLESLELTTSARQVETEYVVGLGWLARIYRQQNEPARAHKELDKALTFAREHLGENSAEFNALRQMEKVIE